METNYKVFYRSKTFWVGVAGIVSSVGMLLSGEVTINSFIVEVIPSITGVLAIIARWDGDKPLGFGE